MKRKEIWFLLLWNLWCYGEGRNVDNYKIEGVKNERNFLISFKNN